MSENAGVDALVAIAEGTQAETADDDGIPAGRDALRIGEGAARTPSRSAEVAVRIADLLTTDVVDTDRQMALPQRASPYGAAVPCIAASLGRQAAGCRNLGALKTMPDHA